MEVKTASAEETQKIGKKLAHSLKARDVVCLYGELGSGKTVLARGIAQGLGITKRILSPTFVLLRRYPITQGGKKIFLEHLDLYRIEDTSMLGLDEIFDSPGIVLVEWAEKLKEFLPKKRIDVKIKKLNQNERQIEISHI